MYSICLVLPELHVFWLGEVAVNEAMCKHWSRKQAEGAAEPPLPSLPSLLITQIKDRSLAHLMHSLASLVPFSCTFLFLLLGRGFDCQRVTLVLSGHTTKIGLLYHSCSRLISIHWQPDQVFYLLTENCKTWRVRTIDTMLPPHPAPVLVGLGLPLFPSHCRVHLFHHEHIFSQFQERSTLLPLPVESTMS